MLNKNQLKKLKSLFDKIYAKKPKESPKFSIGDLVKAGSIGVSGRVIKVEWCKYAGHWLYEIDTIKGVVSKAEYVLIKI